MPPRLCSSFVLAPLLLALAACGGKVGSPVTVQPNGDGGADSGFDDRVCVNIEVQSFDQSCLADTDCTGIYAGQLCPDTCAGCVPNAAINNAGEARYQAETASVLGGEVCSCPLQGVPRCIANSCVECPVGGGGAPGCVDLTGGADSGVTSTDDGGDDTSDAGTGGLDGGIGDDDGGMFVNDAGQVCVDVEAAEYDQSCSVSSDCTLIETGALCDGACDCGGDTAINISGEPQYSQAISGIMFQGCPCVAIPPPACSAGVCVPCDGQNPPPECTTNHG